MWFFFAIAACAFPLLGIVLNAKHPMRHPWLFSVGSFLCFAALCVDELYTIRRRCFSGDFGGIEDTIGAVLLITAAAALAVAVLNIVLLGIHCSRD